MKDEPCGELLDVEVRGQRLGDPQVHQAIGLEVDPGPHLARLGRFGALVDGDQPLPEFVNLLLWERVGRSSVQHTVCMVLLKKKTDLEDALTSSSTSSANFFGSSVQAE